MDSCGPRPCRFGRWMSRLLEDKTMKFKRQAVLLLLLFSVLFSLFACAPASAPNVEPTGSAFGTTQAPIEESTPAAPEPQPEPRVELTIDEEHSKKGLISFSVKYRVEGDFMLYLANEDGIISGYPSLSKSITEVRGSSEDSDAVLLEQSFEDVMLVPTTSHLVAYDRTADVEYSVEIDRAYALAENPFIFAALSDVHYNRYYSEGPDDALYAFDNALDFIDSLEANFVAIAGDLSSRGEVSAYEAYNQAIEDRIYPVYTCTGNHDDRGVSSGNWKRYINTDIQSNLNVVNVAKNGLDFVYKPYDLKGDVFVFLSQVRWEYGSASSSTILDASQLDWLEDVLEEYKDQTVYLFFHSFLCGPDGEGHTGVGNLSNGKYEYDLPYTYGASDEVRFRALLKEYKNVMWFSGHSHWMFEMDVYNPITNFSNFDGEYAYMIHVPSVTEPRYIGPDDSSRTGMNGKSSQGWICYDYGDTVVFLPVEFTTGEFLYSYMEIVHTGALAD